MKNTKFTANNSIILRIKNETLSRYYFYMNQNIYGDFQYCINVPLNISQISQENTCARVSFLIKLQPLGLQLY